MGCGGGGGGWGGEHDFCLFVVVVLSCLHAEELLPFLRIMTLFLCWDVFICCQQ